MSLTLNSLALDLVILQMCFHEEEDMAPGAIALSHTTWTCSCTLSISRAAVEVLA